MYELIVLWATGEKETHSYETLDDARQGERNYWMAFGNQVSWIGINRK